MSWSATQPSQSSVWAVASRGVKDKAATIASAHDHNDIFIRMTFPRHVRAPARTAAHPLEALSVSNWLPRAKCDSRRPGQFLDSSRRGTTSTVVQ